MELLQRGVCVYATTCAGGGAGATTLDTAPRATVEVGVTVKQGIPQQVRKTRRFSQCKRTRQCMAWGVRGRLCVISFACAIARDCFRICGCSKMLACRVPSGTQMLPVLRLCLDANASAPTALNKHTSGTLRVTSRTVICREQTSLGHTRPAH